MPIYEYECPKCKNRVELLLPMEHRVPYCDLCFGYDEEFVLMNRIFSSILFNMNWGNAKKDISPSKISDRSDDIKYGNLGSNKFEGKEI